MTLRFPWPAIKCSEMVQRFHIVSGSLPSRESAPSWCRAQWTAPPDFVVTQRFAGSCGPFLCMLDRYTQKESTRYVRFGTKRIAISSYYSTPLHHQLYYPVACASVVKSCADAFKMNAENKPTEALMPMPTILASHVRLSEALGSKFI